MKQDTILSNCTTFPTLTLRRALTFSSMTTFMYEWLVFYYAQGGFEVGIGPGD